MQLAWRASPTWTGRAIAALKPLLEVTWATLPMLGILAIGVLLITYVPRLTEGILRWMGRLYALRWQALGSRLWARPKA